MSIKTLTKYTLYGTPSLPPTHGHYNKKDRTGLGANSMKRFSVRMVQNNAVGIYTLSHICIYAYMHICIAVHAGVRIELIIFLDPLVLRINCLVIRELLNILFLNPDPGQS